MRIGGIELESHFCFFGDSPSILCIYIYIYIDFSGKIWQSTVIFAGMRYGLLYDMMINIFYLF